MYAQKNWIYWCLKLRTVLLDEMHIETTKWSFILNTIYENSVYNIIGFYHETVGKIGIQSSATRNVL